MSTIVNIDRHHKLLPEGSVRGESNTFGNGINAWRLAEALLTPIHLDL